MSVATTHVQPLGEVSGAFLLGLLNSFHELEVLPAGHPLRGLGDLDPAGWYPYAQLMNLIQGIRAEVPRAGAIFFRAGIHFMRLWYDHGPGRDMVHSGRDWLYANESSAGYNSVVRGGTRDEVGWCVILEIDEAAGYVVYENVMPLSPDYIRGVFYGGCLLFDDMDYIDATVTSEPYPANPCFTRTLVRLSFRYKPRESRLDLEALAGGGPLPDPADLGPEDVRRLLWRHRSMGVRHGMDADYLQEINGLLVDAYRRNLRLSEELTARVQELEQALLRVRSLEGLLPICAWCNRMRDDDAGWVPMEHYLASRTSASFTHAICPECASRWK